MQKLVTAAELARNYGVRPETVLAWQRRGIIPCRRAGQRPVLFDPAEVDAALRARAERLRGTTDE